MPDRKYSVSEIDRMRRAIFEMRLLPYGGDSIQQIIEERLRTYMLNGTDPEELEAEAMSISAIRKARREAQTAV